MKRNEKKNQKRNENKLASENEMKNNNVSQTLKLTQNVKKDNLSNFFEFAKFERFLRIFMVNMFLILSLNVQQTSDNYPSFK
jgi:hypothetical protein